MKTEQEMWNILETSNKINSRTKAMMALLLELGMRVPELRSMKVGDLMIDDENMTVITGKSRRILHAYKGRKLLLSWLEEHPFAYFCRASLWKEASFQADIRKGCFLLGIKGPSVLRHRCLKKHAARYGDVSSRHLFDLSSDSFQKLSQFPYDKSAKERLAERIARSVASEVIKRIKIDSSSGTGEWEVWR